MSLTCKYNNYYQMWLNNGLYTIQKKQCKILLYSNILEQQQQQQQCQLYQNPLVKLFISTFLFHHFTRILSLVSARMAFQKKN
ncbi:hypothetical protein DERF_006574 [Dermatophagoides farinae]|uniref:Uncharacterized protein n=1 Tax=Dermatophagoides farinae TaxID=6954 RepID=A0A922HYQ2_DERFA|nr:hypothetical protein DERF_006574 [Dermatophagoides farinae]